MNSSESAEAVRDLLKYVLQVSLSSTCVELPSRVYWNVPALVNHTESLLTGF